MLGDRKSILHRFLIIKHGYHPNSRHPDRHMCLVVRLHFQCLSGRFVVFGAQARSSDPSSSRCNGATGAAGVSQGDLCERNRPGIRRPLGCAPLCTSVGVTQQELTDAALTMRKLMYGAHDRKNDLQRTLEAALQPVQDLHPRRRRSELDEMWAAHAHLPTETESEPLLNAPALQADADESTTKKDDQDHEDPTGP